MLARKIKIEYKTRPLKNIKKVSKKIKKEEIDFPVGLSLIVIVISVFFTILVIHQSTQLMNRQYYLCELTNNQKALEQQNLKLVNEVNSLQSLDRIENIATREFGMIRPEFEKNILFVDLDKTSVKEKIDGLTN